MLERVPRVQAVYANQNNAVHRSVIDACVRAQAPLDERFRQAVMKPQAFMACQRLIVLPVAPSKGFVEFSVEVGHAWDETKSGERRKLGLPQEFLHTGSTYYAFFGFSGTGCTMDREVHKAIEERRAVEMLELLKAFKEGTIDFEGLKAKMKPFSLEMESVEFAGAGMHYVAQLRVRGSVARQEKRVSNFVTEMHAKTKSLQYFLDSLAKRLSFGFNPAV